MGRLHDEPRPIHPACTGGDPRRPATRPGGSESGARRRAPARRARGRRRRHPGADTPPGRRGPACVPRRARRHPRAARQGRGRLARTRSPRPAGLRASGGGGAPPPGRVREHGAPAPRVRRVGRGRAGAARAAWRRTRGDPHRPVQRPRRPARDEPDTGEHLPGAREVRARPHAGGACREARPGHRPRRGDPPRHPGPLPADEEQPGPHRRAGRRARPRSSRASPSASCAATSRRRSRTRRSSRSISAR